MIANPAIMSGFKTLGDAKDKVREVLTPLAVKLIDDNSIT